MLPAERKIPSEMSRDGPSDSTPQSLVEAALRLFGLKGYDATSIREIASEAKANVASIGYHFGGKDGLRRACAEQVAATIRVFANAAFVEGLDPSKLTPAEARERLHGFVARVVPFVLTDKRARLMMHFMIREMANPSIAIDIVYGGVVEPTHRRICALWAAVTGEEAESETVRLAVFGVVGQVFYFRFAQEIVVRRMAWKEYGAREALAIGSEISGLMDSALDRHIAARTGK